jgi:hypothetical protein
MATKPPLQKILQGILHTEKESKQNQTTGEEKTRKRRVTLILLHIIKPLTNKDNYVAGTTMYLSILTLNVNELNSPIKRH